jgi:hypothetical protein
MWGGGDGGVGFAARRRAGIAVVVAIAAVVLVAVVASGSRVPLATEGKGGWDLFIPNLPSQPLDRALTTRDTTVEQQSRGPGVGAFALLFQVVVIMLAAAVVVVSGRAMARSWRRYQRVPAPPFEERPLVTSPRELVDALDEGIGARAAGPTADVIIECWVRREEAAAGAGVERLPSETASVLAARVLADLHAPPTAIDALLVRYRTARYSHHRLDDHDRLVALDALRQIREAIVGTSA